MRDEGERVPFCSACGAGVSTQVCSACGLPLAAASVPAAVAVDTPPYAPRELYLQRTPFQAAVLTFATFGLYAIYWMVRARRRAERRLERHVTSGWFFFTLLIPIYGLIVFFESMSTAQRRVAAAGEPVRIAFWVWALGYLVVGLLWRLPGSYFVVTYLDGLCLLPIYAAFARAERREAPDARWARFTAWEWIVAVAGSVFAVLVYIGALIDVALAERVTVLAVAAAWAIALVVTWRTSPALAPHAPSDAAR